MKMDDHWHLRASALTLLLAMSSIAYGCGRTEFSELSGSISSVNYPSQYANSINCTYSIRSIDLRRTIYMGFTDFDTEESHDKVEIWCSTSVSSKRTFSGQYTNRSFFRLPPCNVVIVNFRTDGSAVGRGFNLVFYWLLSACGKTEFHDLSGFISSPNYPESYPPGTNCTYSITSLGFRESLFIGFTDISTESCCDKVEIWCSANASTKRTFSGEHTSYSSLTLQSCKEIKVNFRTDGSVAGRGFKLLFYWFASDCGRTEYSGLRGFVSSVNYPHEYSSNINCTYSIIAPGPNQSIYMAFTDIDTEACCDKVEIWCSGNPNNKQNFSGQDSNHSYLTLQSCNEVKINFRTDHSVVGRGFKLFFYWITPAPNLVTANLTTASSVQTDFPENILAVLASLLGVSVFIIILMAMIFAIWRVKRKKTVLKTPSTRHEVRGAVVTRGRSNDGYSLEPISTCRRPVSVEYEIEDPDYEQMDPPNDNDEDDEEYQNVEDIVR